MILHARVTELTINLLPDDHPEQQLFAVRVVWRSHDRYAVEHFGSVLNRDGEWEHEPIPSERDDDFKQRTRFDYETARRLACDQAPHIEANGRTAEDVIRRAEGVNDA